MNLPTQTSTNNASPAEMKFLREWAERAPDLLRQQGEQLQRDVDKAAFRIKAVSIGLGAALGANALRTRIPSGWRWASGIAGAALMGLGATTKTNSNGPAIIESADKIAQSPQLKEELAEYFCAHITASDIQNSGIEGAIRYHALDFITPQPKVTIVGPNTAGIEIMDSPMDSHALAVNSKSSGICR